MAERLTLPALPDNVGTRPLLPLVDALPRYLSAKQTAFVLNLTPAEVRARVRKKSLTGHVIGSSVYVDSQSVRVAYHALRAIRAA